MLNEVWRLLQALDRSDIKRVRKHKRVQTPGRTSPCLRVCLDKDGKVGSVQDINDDDWPSWTVMEGNQSSFPVARVQEPLLELERGHEAWTKLDYHEKDNRRRLPADAVRLDSLEDVLKSVKIIRLSGKAQTHPFDRDFENVHQRRALSRSEVGLVEGMNLSTLKSGTFFFVTTSFAAIRSYQSRAAHWTTSQWMN